MKGLLEGGAYGRRGLIGATSGESYCSSQNAIRRGLIEREGA